MGRLRVLMLAWEFPPKITGGLGVACAGLAGALRERVDLDLLLPEDAAGDPYGEGTGYQGDLWRRVLAFAQRVPVRPGRYDLIHAHDWLTVPAAAELARRTGLQVVMQVHSLELDRSGRRNEIFGIERAGMRMARRVIAVSRFTAGICEANYGIPRGKLRVVWNGVGISRSVADAVRRPKVVFIGRLTAQKSPWDFVRMAAKVAERVPGSEFQMIGAGELREPMARLAGELGLAGRLAMPGFLGRTRVMEELETAAVLCVPSRSEPFGLVALEAAALGVAVVLTGRCGVREVLPSAEVVPVGGVDAMAEAVVGLLENGGRRRDLAGRLRKEAQAASWERAAEGVLAVYRELREG